MQLIRSLAGMWGFRPDPTGDLPPEMVQPSRTIPVPMPWQAVFPDMQYFDGCAWYHHRFTLDSDWLAGEVLLTFGAVDYACDVYVNGVHAGAHAGGYTPFTLTIRRLLNAGDNHLLVRVVDPVQHQVVHARSPHFPVEKNGQEPPGALSIPHGKQEWYVNVGGIWGDVTLRAVPNVYIDRVRIMTALDGTVSVRVTHVGTLDGTVEAEAQWDGQIVASASVVAGAEGTDLTLVVPSAHHWSPDHPALYTLVVRLGADERHVRFGIRTIETRDGYLLLNSQPLYLVGALDQDFYRETIYTPPSEAFLRDQFSKARSMGLNCLRCHIKVPDPMYLDLADEMGLLIWAEVPSWRTFYPKGSVHDQQIDLDADVRQRVEQTLHEMIERDFNHPSVIIWTLVNEDWGTMLPFSSADRAWLRSLYDLCKRLDPTRLVVDNSACPTPWGPNLHVKSDLDDWHTYSNIPDAACDFVRMVEQLNMRPLWSYSAHGDTDRRGDEPVIVSEFGNWGLASITPYLNPDGSEPGWFDLGPWWSGWEGEPGWMKGVLDRYQRFGMETIFGDFDAFAEATQWHQYQAIKFEIEVLRRQPAIMGYIITEFTDCYWEANGLLDFDRRPKVYHEALRHFLTQDVLSPELRHTARSSGETLNLRVHGSHFTQRGWAEAMLTVSLNERKLEEIAAGSLPRGHVRLIADVSLALPSVSHAEVITLDLRLADSTGTALAHNTASVLVLPAAAAQAAYDRPLALISHRDPWGGSSDTLAAALRHVGYSVTASLDDAALALSTAPTPEVLAWVRAGGDLLFLCSGSSPFFWAQGRGGVYGGNWMSCWSWLRPEAHSRLAHRQLNPLKLPFMHIMPRQTITGLPVEAPIYHGDFLAGQVTGWVNHPAVHTVQFRYGAGRVIMTTFALTGAIGSDTVGTAMLHDLIDRLADPGCDPTLRANW